MQAYKNQRRHTLEEHGWEVVEVVKSDEWWADEYWKVESRRVAWGLAFVLTFLVDPGWEGPRKGGQGVWKITATRDVPPDGLSAEENFAVLDMTKGLFNEKLTAFAASLEAYRNADHG